MKLIKVFIKNFKGIDSAKTIELEKDGLTLLDGPNGFGKTTIFDVIELCLRGSLYKTTVNKDVTADRADYSKAFYQNNIEDDVIIKAHFKNISGDDLVIIKYLSKDTTGRSGTGRKFKPDDFDILDTYTEEVSNFNSSELIKENIRPLSQEDINRFFFSDNTKVSIENTFLLFNYLQQEENIFFLKKSEREKRAQLDFLFQTEEESSTLDSIKKFVTKLKKTCEKIDAKINSLNLTNVKFEGERFKQLIKNKEFKFDSEKPFEGIDFDELDLVCRQYLTDIEELRKLVENFEPSEFEKSKIKQSLNNYKENKNAQLAFILERFIDEESFQKVKELFLQRQKYLEFVKSENKEFKIGELLNDFDFNDEQIENYKKLNQDLRDLKEEAGTLVNLISELNDLRERTFKHYQEFHDRQGIEFNDCPLCGQEYSSIKELTSAIEEKKEKLKGYHKEKIEALTNKQNQIGNLFVDPAIQKIEKYLKSEVNDLDEKFWSILLDVKDYSSKVEEFNKFLKDNGFSLTEFQIDQKVDGEVLNEAQEKLKDKLKEMSEEIKVDSKKVEGDLLFKKYFNEDKDLFKELKVEDLEKKQDYILSRYDSKRKDLVDVLEKRKVEIEKIQQKYDEIKMLYDQAIKSFKKKMIDKIRIPFYLNSGKILKHYQQGMGIFIQMNENTNSIRFITDNESDHDAVHHLSSGQLAVVSLAFCLSLNNVYKVSEGYKFLAIDDPVQTMDDLNIHSFIELLRHNFSDYQVLLSTHENSVSTYFNYKFGKFGFETKKINVQDHFYPLVDN